MALAKYFLSAPTGLRKGDVVFYVADQKGSNWRKRSPAHVGLVRTDCPVCEPGAIASIYHMTLQKVEKSDWVIGQSNGTRDCVVNLCGTYENLSQQKRAKIIDAALQIFDTRKSVINDNLYLYYFGDPKRREHPVYGKAENLYAFTCANFVDQCYKDARRPLVDMTNIPFVAEIERKDFEQFMIHCRLREPSKFIQSTPFKRINPSYLAHAFRLAAYPLNANSWGTLQDHGFFVPLPIVEL